MARIVGNNKIRKRLSKFIGNQPKVTKDRLARASYNRVKNEMERTLKRSAPSHPTFKLNIRESDVYSKMRYDLKKMQEESSLTQVMSTAELESLVDNSTEKYTPYTKGRLTEKSAARLLFNRADVDSMSDRDVAILWGWMTTRDKKDNLSYSQLSKSQLELLRTKFLNSEHVSAEMKEYLRKSDLQAIEEFRRFIKMARKRASIYSEVDYDLLTSDYYEEIGNSTLNTPKKDVLNFVKFQMEMNDIERANKIYDRAAKLKVNRKHLFTTAELGEYL